MIQGIQIKNLKKHTDSRGYLMEILRNDDEIFSQFGQIYVAENKTGWRDKEWHYHKFQDDFMTCIQGAIELCLFDARKKSKTFNQKQKMKITDKNPRIVKVPSGVYHIYHTTSKKPSLVINIPNKVYNIKSPDEQRVPFK